MVVICNSADSKTASSPNKIWTRLPPFAAKAWPAINKSLCEIGVDRFRRLDWMDLATRNSKLAATLVVCVLVNACDLPKTEKTETPLSWPLRCNALPHGILSEIRERSRCISWQILNFSGQWHLVQFQIEFIYFVSHCTALQMTSSQSTNMDYGAIVLLYIL